MTKAEALRLSWELWDLVAKLPKEKLLSDRPKSYAIEIMGFRDGVILGNCFACEYARNNRTLKTLRICPGCPVASWQQKFNVNNTPCVQGEYGQFTNAEGESERRHLALVIRDLMTEDNKMLNPIKFFVEYWAKRKREKRLIDSVLSNCDTDNLTSLVIFIALQGRFRRGWVGDKTYSISKRISYEMSPYGSIVNIDNGPPLNACFYKYGLTEKQAEMLYDVIIRANGSDPGYEKFLRCPEFFHRNGSRRVHHEVYSD